MSATNVADIINAGAWLMSLGIVATVILVGMRILNR